MSDPSPAHLPLHEFDPETASKVARRRDRAITAGVVSLYSQGGAHLLADIADYYITG